MVRYTAKLLALLALTIGAPALAINLTINAGVPSNVYISGVSANGIGIGDNANPCTQALPCLTWDKAVATVPSGGTIWLNGAAVYKSATATTITKPMTVRGVVPGESILAGVGTTQSLLVALTGGGSATVRDVIIDPSQNTGGTASGCVTLTAQSTTYGFTLQNVTFRNWGSLICIAAPANLKANVLVASSTFTGGDVRGAIDIRTFIAGGFEIRDSTVTITNQNTAGFGGVVIHGAASSGLHCRIYDTTISVATTRTTGSSPIFYGGLCAGISDSVIDGDTGNTGTPAEVTTSAPAGTWRSYTLGVGTNDAGDASEMPCDRCTVRNYKIYNFTNGGIGGYIGGESGDPTKQNDMLAEYLVVEGNAQAMSGALHGLMNGYSTNGTIRFSSATTTALPVVDKATYGSYIHDVTFSDFSSTGALAKGSTNPTWLRINGTSDTVGGSLSLWRASTCTGCGGAEEGRHTTSLTVTDGTWTIDGTVGNILVTVETGGNTATASGNTYRALNGATQNAASFRMGDGVNYASCTTYKAAREASATCSMP